MTLETAFYCHLLHTIIFLITIKNDLNQPQSRNYSSLRNAVARSCDAANAKAKVANVSCFKRRPEQPFQHFPRASLFNLDPPQMDYSPRALFSTNPNPPQPFRVLRNTMTMVLRNNVAIVFHNDNFSLSKTLSSLSSPKTPYIHNPTTSLAPPAKTIRNQNHPTYLPTYIYPPHSPQPCPPSLHPSFPEPTSVLHLQSYPSTPAPTSAPSPRPSPPSPSAAPTPTAATPSC